jgi:DNA-binding XRE family transcriptional regulator
MKKYTLLWQKLRRLRRGKLDLTQMEVAQKLGVSLQTFIYWETGKVKPKAENLVKLVELFGNQVYKEEEMNN